MQPQVRSDESLVEGRQGRTPGIVCLISTRPVVMMQNSGLGVSVNALTSLAILYRIPLLMLIGWRGHDGKDAPEHRIMGASMLRILDALDLPYRVLDPHLALHQLDELAAIMCARSMPAAAILRPETLT